MDTTSTAPRPAAGSAAHRPPELGAEVRASLLLLGLCAGVLVCVTVAAQTTLALFG
jgi:hypothetical protein